MRRLSTAVLSFISLALISFNQYAQNPPAANTIGLVAWVKGDVKAISSDKVSRTLQRRSAIFEHDTLTTDPTSAGQIVFTDNSIISLRANTQLVLDNYKFGKNVPKAQSSYTATLVKGGFRTITGLITKNNPKNYQINTPVSTIGVRSTAYEVVLTGGIANAPDNSAQLTGVISGNNDSINAAINAPTDLQSNYDLQRSNNANNTHLLKSLGNIANASNAPTLTNSTTNASLITNTSTVNTTSPASSSTPVQQYVQRLEGTPVVTTPQGSFVLSASTSPYVATDSAGKTTFLNTKPAVFTVPTPLFEMTYEATTKLTPGPATGAGGGGGVCKPGQSPVIEIQ